jgi:toxin ParE1/3/4
MAARPKALKLHPEARAELQESVLFYRQRAGERWATRFKERVAEGLSAIAADPERYSSLKELPGVQRIRLKQFPFALLYVNRADYVWIVAIAHGSRKPGYWLKRLA